MDASRQIYYALYSFNHYEHQATSFSSHRLMF